APRGRADRRRRPAGRADRHRHAVRLRLGVPAGSPAAGRQTRSGRPRRRTAAARSERALERRRSNLSGDTDSWAHAPILRAGESHTMATVEQRVPDTSESEVAAATPAAEERAAGGIPVENPATGEIIATVPDLSADEVAA